MEDDATKDLAEFALANAIYAVLVEGHAAEINSRRNAMDNATKVSFPLIWRTSRELNLMIYFT